MKHFLLFLLLSLHTVAMAASVPFANLTTALDEQLATLAQADEFSGAVLVACGDEVLLEKAWGYAHKGHSVPNTADTRFNLGSVDKQFTMVAIMALEQAGRLDLDGTVGDYLPDYPNRDVASHVTVRQLLAHTSGMGFYWTEELYRNIGFLRTLEDFAGLFVGEPLAFRPGTDWAYSNNGYIVLGLIIEALTGENYHDHIARTILRPLSMNDTGPFAVDSTTPDLATHYTKMRPEDAIAEEWVEHDASDPWYANYYTHPPVGASAGGGYSTLGDLFVFSQALNGALLHKDTFNRVISPANEDFADEGSWLYGYGMQLWNVGKDNFSYGHSGGGPGNGAIWRYYPAHDLTVIVLTNQDGSVGHPLRIVGEHLASGGDSD